eukprot:GHVO01045385.1.p2 GENE.GHVO01045385.1~~GHVO01045385.1.p2  ORF type:complete len:134 (-),score=34.88 GHVO01045385.1:484-885(-)
MAAKLRTTCSMSFKFPPVAEEAGALEEELEELDEEELQLELELNEEDQDEEDDQVLDDEGVQVEEGVVDVGVQVVEGGVQLEEGGVQEDVGVDDELEAWPPPLPSLNHQDPLKTPMDSSAKKLKRPSVRSRPP